jgi:uncharacterized delta-60 repeat protein
MIKDKLPSFFNTQNLMLTVGGLFALLMGIRLASFAFQDLNNEVTGVGLQSTGKIIFVGRFTDHYIKRKNNDGTEDTSFSSTWTVGGFNRAILSVAIQSDDKIVVGGEFTNFDDSLVGYIARLNQEGSLDTEFSNTIGTGFNDQVHTLSIQADGKILVGGAFTSFNGSTARYIVRLNPNGTLDDSFSSGNHFNAPVLAIELQEDGQILVGGNFTAEQNTSAPYLFKLQANGETSTQFQFKVTK